MGTWDVDLRTGRVVWNRQNALLLGYDAEASQASTKRWWALVHEDDRPAVRQAMKNARNNGSLYQAEHRIRRADTGELRWLAPYGRIHYSGDGRPTRFVGVTFDITERKQTDMQRQEWTRELERRVPKSTDERARPDARPPPRVGAGFNAHGATRTPANRRRTARLSGANACRDTLEDESCVSDDRPASRMYRAAGGGSTDRSKPHVHAHGCRRTDAAHVAAIWVGSRPALVGQPDQTAGRRTCTWMCRRWRLRCRKTTRRCCFSAYESCCSTCSSAPGPIARRSRWWRMVRTSSRSSSTTTASAVILLRYENRGGTSSASSVSESGWKPSTDG